MTLYREEVLVPGWYQYVEDDNVHDPRTGKSSPELFAQFLDNNPDAVTVRQREALSHADPSAWWRIGRNPVQTTGVWTLFEVHSPVDWTGTGWVETATPQSTAEPYRPHMPGGTPNARTAWLVVFAGLGLWWAARRSR